MRTPSSVASAESSFGLRGPAYEESMTKRRHWVWCHQLMGRSKRVTLADVAREAGLSVQTVSHVLTDNPTVRLPEATRERVRFAAAKLGYTPNRMAQAIRGGKTNVIGVWFPIDRPTSSFLTVLQLVSAKAQASGYDLMIIGLDIATALTHHGKLPTLWPVDGIFSIDSGKAVEQFKEVPQNWDVPSVILGFETVANGDSVAWKVEAAMKQATKSLIAKGCRRIVHVTLDWILADFPKEGRRRGYAEAMVEAGLEPEFLAVQCETSSAAEREATEYLRNHAAPDAFTSFTDSLAIGAARAILATGAKIPQDCRILGFGNYPESGDFSVPLSTMVALYPEIVDQAWTWLMERVENPGLEPRFIELDLEIIERESTR